LSDFESLNERKNFKNTAGLYSKLFPYDEYDPETLENVSSNFSGNQNKLLSSDYTT
jgi:hypothetical protein